MERIAAAVKKELGRLGSPVGMAEIVAAWPGSVGEQIARNAWPARIIRDGTLHVAASSSAWAFELGQLQTTILERLRRSLGEAAPTRVRFTVGCVPEAPAPPRKRKKPPPPSPADTARAAEIAAPIADEELRALVARAAAASLARAAAGRRF